MGFKIKEHGVYITKLSLMQGYMRVGVTVGMFHSKAGSSQLVLNKIQMIKQPQMVDQSMQLKLQLHAVECQLQIFK